MYARKRVGTFLCTQAYENYTIQVSPLLSILQIEEVTAILRCLALKWGALRHNETFKGQFKGGRVLSVYVNYMLSCTQQQ